MPADGELDPDDVRGSGEGRVGVAVAAGELGRGAPLVSEVDSTVVEGAARVEHGGLVGDVDLHQLGGVLAGVRVVADHHGERLADIADGVAGEHRLQEGAEVGAGDGEPHRDDVIFRQVLGGDHGRDAGRLPRLGDVQLADLARGRRGPDDPGPELAGGADVVAEPAAAAQQAGVFQARQPGADDGHGFAGFRRACAVATTASTMPW